MDPATNYPEEWETHGVLKDGSTVELRPIKPSDRTALERFHSRQSQESIYFRYFRYRPELSDNELDHFTHIDYQDRMAFVAMLGSELVAVARYEGAEGQTTAEVAFFVDDQHHGRGLGTLMLEYLAAAARERGLDGLTATVLPENYRMLGVFRKAGFEVKTRFADGVIEVDLGIDVTPEASAVISDRHLQATARSVARILRPRTVAVVGASRRPGSVGHELVRNVATGSGSRSPEAAVVVGVNPKADVVAGVATYPSVAAAAEALAADPAGSSPEVGSGVGSETAGSTSGLDLVVVAVPASKVLGVVAECAEVGVSGLLVISAGFSDFDPAGDALEEQLVDLARDNGMRLIGPAAFGMANTDPLIDLRLLFEQVPIRPGRVALASQSGPLGAAVLVQLGAHQVGVSSFVGFGNRADVSVNDLLAYWHGDPLTDAVVLYVENYGNLRNFSDVARRTSEVKPIITIQPSAPDLAELLVQAGVICVDSVSQLADQARVAATQPVARGRRVAIVANSASLARLAEAACVREGLEVVVPRSVRKAARNGTILIGDLDTVSLRSTGQADDYEPITVAAAVSEEVDLVMVAFAPTGNFGAAQLVELLDRIDRSVDKPTVATGLADLDGLPSIGMPVFTFPEEAAQALGRHARYGEWRAAAQPLPGRSDSEVVGGRTPARSVPDDELADEARRADQVIDGLLAGREQAHLTMASPELQPLLDAIGLPLAPWGAADQLDDLLVLADQLGYPVVLKAGNLAVRSVGESGGAAIDLHDRNALVAAHGRMTEQLGRAMRTAVVQSMVASVGTVRLELLRDPAFGGMIAVGPGGSVYAAAAPVARRFLPVDEVTANELVDALARAGPIVPEIDPEAREALVDLIGRLVRVPAISERVARVSMNPVLLAGAETVATDVEILLQRKTSSPLAQVRHL